jgi:hypothetical protein
MSKGIFSMKGDGHLGGAPQMVVPIRLEEARFRGQRSRLRFGHADDRLAEYFGATEPTARQVKSVDPGGESAGEVTGREDTVRSSAARILAENPKRKRDKTEFR